MMSQASPEERRDCEAVDLEELRDKARRCARTMRNKAARLPPYDGSDGTFWVVHKGMRDDLELGLRLLWTRDTGHRKGGWFKARELDRCFHLTAVDLRLLPNVRYEGRGPVAPLVFDLLLQEFFGEAYSCVWFEYAKEKLTADASDVREVRHWRLFCDAEWEPLEAMREEARRELRALGWIEMRELERGSSEAVKGSPSGG